MMKYSANERKINLRAVIDQPANLALIEKVYGDKRRFLQILVNFMSNSLKFTDEGGCVSIHLKVLDH